MAAISVVIKSKIWCGFLIKSVRGQYKAILLELKIKRSGYCPKCWVGAVPLGNVHPCMAGVDCDVVYVIQYLKIIESHDAMSRQRGLIPARFRFLAA